MGENRWRALALKPSENLQLLIVVFESFLVLMKFHFFVMTAALQQMRHSRGFSTYVLNEA